MTAKTGRFPLIEFLRFMLDAVERITAYTADLDKATFLEETIHGRMRRDAVIFNLGVLGESAHDVCQHFPNFAEQTPQVPFHRIYAMRNQIFHGYHSIDHALIWTTCTVSLPPLEAALRTAIKSLEDAP